MNPIVTVVITSYNYARFLEEALHSALHQTFQSQEILVIDDGSTDASAAIIKKYAAQDRRIRAIFHPENLGLFLTLEESISEAKGEYIHWLSADDTRAPTFLEKSMEVLLNRPECSLCCSADLASKKISSIPIYFSAKQSLDLFGKGTFSIAGHTAVFKKKTVERYNNYNHKLGFLSDWFLMHTIALHEGFAYIPEVLAFWREHALNFSVQNRGKKREIYRQLLNLLFAPEKKETKKLFIHSGLLAAALKEHAWHLFYKPSYWTAFYYCFLRSFRWHMGLR